MSDPIRERAPEEYGLRDISGEDAAKAEEARLARTLARIGGKPATAVPWAARFDKKLTIAAPSPPSTSIASTSYPAARLPRARGNPRQPPRTRATPVDPNENPSTFADLSIYELRPFKVIDGGNTTELMGNFAYMLDQPVHPETAARADDALARVRATKIPPSSDANGQLKAWRMLGSATMKSSTQAVQATKNWEDTDAFVTKQALDSSFNASPDDLMKLMNEINSRLLPGIMVKEGEHEVPAKPGMRLGEQAAAGMDTGGEDINPTRMYIPGNEVEGAMKDLCTWLSAELARDDTNPVELAARAYQEVVTIHPFHDANGRSARFVMDFVLQRKGLLPAALGEDVNLCCFPRIDPDKQPSPTGALNVVLKGVERAYAQIRDKKQPAGPLPDLPGDPPALLAALATHQDLLATYDVPVPVVASGYTELDTYLAEVKDGEWAIKKALAEQQLSQLNKVIRGLPVLRNELGKLTEALGSRVGDFNNAAAAADFASRAPKSIKDWIAVGPDAAADLLGFSPANATTLLAALEACNATPPVPELSAAVPDFNKDFGVWSQRLMENLTKQLALDVSAAQRQIRLIPARYAKEALTDQLGVFQREIVRREALFDSEAKALHDNLMRQKGFNTDSPAPEDLKQAIGEAVDGFAAAISALKTAARSPLAGEVADSLCGFGNRIREKATASEFDSVRKISQKLETYINNETPVMTRGPISVAAKPLLEVLSKV